MTRTGQLGPTLDVASVPCWQFRVCNSAIQIFPDTYPMTESTYSLLNSSTGVEFHSWLLHTACAAISVLRVDRQLVKLTLFVKYSNLNHVFPKGPESDMVTLHLIPFSRVSTWRHRLNTMCETGSAIPQESVELLGTAVSQSGVGKPPEVSLIRWVPQSAQPT